MKKIDNEMNTYKGKNLDNQLLKGYNEALKKSEFKELVSKLHISETILMKYTSILEESAIEYNHCVKCPNILECKNKINGFCFLPKITNGMLEFEYKACKYKKEARDKTKYLDNIFLFDVPKEIKEAKMKNIYLNDKKRLEVIKWVNNFISSYENDKHQKGLYLTGNFGCGKTYIIAALFNELANRNIKSAIIFWPEYLRSLKANFNDNYNERYEYIKKVPLLLIDDIGAENLTPWSRDEILSPILQYRMQENLPTFLTSNLNIDELEHHLSTSREKVDEIKARRIIERIKQLTEQKEMISENLRK